jgi:hypothetical protein
LVENGSALNVRDAFMDGLSYLEAEVKMNGPNPTDACPHEKKNILELTR